MYLMKNVLQNYAWGSHSFIQNLLHQSSDAPIAEMWMGSHPKAPSQILLSGEWHRLDQFLAEHCAESSHTALPYLLKVLAAEVPLSIQAHPNKSQAKAGFARENAQNIPLDAPYRNYKDDNHKPELICALTPFQAMCGFRAYQEIISNFTALKVEQYFSTFDQFLAQPCPITFRLFFTEMMSLSADDLARVTFAMNDILSHPNQLHASVQPIVFWCSKLQKEFPNDIGILAPLYLNLIYLQPHEALYLDAGILHAYLSGAGMEIMANSDNVLRGGLTPKHIDIAELLASISFEPWPVVIIQPTAVKAGLAQYSTPAKEFYLQYFQGIPGLSCIVDTMQSDTIVFCAGGSGTIQGRDSALAITRGQSIFVPASELPLTLEGTCELYIASSRS